MNSFNPSFRRRSPSALGLGIAAVLAVAGCSSGSTTDGTDPGPTVGEGANRASLQTLQDREAFMSELRTALVEQHSENYFSGEPDNTFTDGGGGGVGSEASAEDSGAPPAGDSDVSQTNVQEVGVDEQDRVKTDGARLYVLNSSYANTGVGPIDEPDVEEPVADGAPVPPVEAGRTTLRVLDMDRLAPDAIPVADIDVDLEGRLADGFYLAGDDASRSAIVVAGGGGFGGWNNSTYFGGSDTLVARVPLSDPASASVDALIRIDGQSVSSRRIDNRLFVATRFYPSIDGAQPGEVDAATWAASVAATTDEELLPRWTDASGNRQALIDPASCFVAEQSDASGYFSPDIVTLSVIDLDTMQPVDSECFLGSSETLYASANAVFLATTRWDYNVGPLDALGLTVDPVAVGTAVDEEFSDPRIDTDIHQFDISDQGLNYVASGSISGHLGWSSERKPYRFSEHNGDLRVVSMPALLNPSVSPVIVSVLREDGQGNLARIAELPNDTRPAPIGKPYEQLYASRFVGDRAYLVTFRQTDPLYVVDLSRPDDPELLGELEITGYSEWLLPIGDSHLLGLGKDAVALDDGFEDGRGGLYQGIKLSLFDVTDPREPQEVSTQRIGERGTESVALYNPRAITIQAATDTHPTRIALGIDVHGSAVSPALESITEPWTWYPWTYTGLHGFDIRTGADARIEARGALVVETATNDTQYGPRTFDDRSVLAGDAAFYIHGDRVHAAHWDSLSNGGAAR